MPQQQQDEECNHSNHPNHPNHNNHQKKNILCHYEVLNLPRDADAAMIKKQYRALALKYHPDKNVNNTSDENLEEQFRLVQQAYECLSDVQERKWYDDHRDAILAGWTTTDGGGGDAGVDGNNSMFLFNVVPFMHPFCYSGYQDDDPDGFYEVYQNVFEEIFQCEGRANHDDNDKNKNYHLPTSFGNSQSEWSQVQQFYQMWESFSSRLNFAWQDKYDYYTLNEEAPNRRIRRLMEEENKKARRTAKKSYNQDVLALVAFCKRRDPRVKAKQVEIELRKAEQLKEQKQELEKRKHEQQKAKQAWLEQAQQNMEELEEADRQAGRVRLADLDDEEEDYDYYGGGKKKKRGKKKKKNTKSKNQTSFNEDDEEDGAEAVKENADEQKTNEEQVEPPSGRESSAVNAENVMDPNDDSGPSLKDVTRETNNGEHHEEEVGGHLPVDEDNDGPDKRLDNDDDEIASSSSSEEEEPPDIWRCECCRKDFKSEGQMQNHTKSKKHKEALKRYQTTLNKQQQHEQDDDIMAEMMDKMAIG